MNKQDYLGRKSNVRMPRQRNNISKSNKKSSGSIPISSKNEYIEKLKNKNK